MKNLKWIVVLFLSVSTTFATTLQEDQQWTQSADGSFSLPMSTNDTQAFGVGWGGDFSLGYRFDHTFSLACVAGYYQYNIQPAPANGSGHLSYVPIMVMPRLNLLKTPIHPYIFCGAGVAFNTLSETVNGIGVVDNKETDLFLAPGLGVLFPVATNIAVFLQSRVDIDFTSNNGLGKNVDSPSIFVPIQGGIGFFVL